MPIDGRMDVEMGKPGEYVYRLAWLKEDLKKASIDGPYCSEDL